MNTIKKQTVKQQVEANREAALAAKTPAEIRAFIESIGCGTKQRWSKAVAAIIEIGGADFYAAKGEVRAATAETLRNSVTHEVTLFVDAKARNYGHMAVCDQDGELLFHGHCPAWQFSYGDPSEQSACECAAAREAIAFAGKIKAAIGAAAIRLVLKVDAQWLTTLAGKASILASDARRLNIELEMEWVRGTSNPADEFTTISGFTRWQDCDLKSLATPYDPKAAAEAAAQAEAEEVEAEKQAEIAAEKAADERAANELAAAKAAGFETIEAHRAHLTAESNAAALALRAEQAKAHLPRLMARLETGMRFGTEKKITTFHQFDSCIATINRLRTEQQIDSLTADEIAALKAIQNFTNEVSQMATA